MYVKWSHGLLSLYHFEIYKDMLTVFMCTIRSGSRDSHFLNGLGLIDCIFPKSPIRQNNATVDMNRHLAHKSSVGFITQQLELYMYFQFLQLHVLFRPLQVPP